MRLNRADLDVQLAGDFLVGITVDEQLVDLMFLDS